jgi:hypothetical protein
MAETARNVWLEGSIGEAPRVNACDAVAVYDKRDGRVIHVHYVVAFEGAERKGEEQQEADALHYARALGEVDTEMGTMCVRDLHQDLPPSRFDLESETLVEMPIRLPHAQEENRGAGRRA